MLNREVHTNLKHNQNQALFAELIFTYDGSTQCGNWYFYTIVTIHYFCWVPQIVLGVSQTQNSSWTKEFTIHIQLRVLNRETRWRGKGREKSRVAIKSHYWSAGHVHILWICFYLLFKNWSCFCKCPTVLCWNLNRARKVNWWTVLGGFNVQ